MFILTGHTTQQKQVTKHFFVWVGNERKKRAVNEKRKIIIYFHCCCCGAVLVGFSWKLIETKSSRRSSQCDTAAECTSSLNQKIGKRNRAESWEKYGMENGEETMRRGKSMSQNPYSVDWSGEKTISTTYDKLCLSRWLQYLASFCYRCCCCCCRSSFFTVSFRWYDASLATFKRKYRTENDK